MSRTLFVGLGIAIVLVVVRDSFAQQRVWWCEERSGEPNTMMRANQDGSAAEVYFDSDCQELVVGRDDVYWISVNRKRIRYRSKTDRSDPIQDLVDINGMPGVEIHGIAYSDPGSPGGPTYIFFMQCDGGGCDLYRVPTGGGSAQLWEGSVSAEPSPIAATSGYVYWILVAANGDKFLLAKNTGNSSASPQLIEVYDFCDTWTRCASDLSTGKFLETDMEELDFVAVWVSESHTELQIGGTDGYREQLGDWSKGFNNWWSFTPDGMAVGAGQGEAGVHDYDRLAYVRDSSEIILYSESNSQLGLIYEGPPNAVAIRDIATENGAYACIQDGVFGDVDESGGANPVSFADITLIVDCFKDAANCTHNIRLKADLSPCGNIVGFVRCFGNFIINFADITMGVDAFKGIAGTSCPLVIP